jgi:sarcosine oxidase subunit beta
VTRTSSQSVVVVGAGAIGLCVALELLEHGAPSVTVLEKGTIGGGSSGLAVGIIETQYLDRLSIAVRAYSMGVFARLERERGLRITRNGYLRLGHSAADRDAFATSVGFQHALGVADAAVLERAEIARLIPDLDPAGIECGLWGPSDGYTDPALACSALAELVRAAGGTIVQGCALDGCDDRPGGGFRLTAGERTYEADVVVNAAGGWAPRVGAILGAPAHALPQRHEALFVRLSRPIEYVMPSVMDYVPGSGRMGLYFRHDAVTRLVAGLHTEDVMKHDDDPDRFRRGWDDPAYLVAVGEALEERLPGLGEVTLGGVWAGIYPISPDGDPSVGPYADRPGIYAALGAGGAGFQSAPGIGRIVAEQVTAGASTTIEGVERLSPDRFSAGS